MPSQVGFRTALLMLALSLLVFQAWFSKAPKGPHQCVDIKYILSLNQPEQSPLTPYESPKPFYCAFWDLLELTVPSGNSGSAAAEPLYYPLSLLAVAEVWFFPETPASAVLPSGAVATAGNGVDVLLGLVAASSSLKTLNVDLAPSASTAPHPTTLLLFCSPFSRLLSPKT